MAVTVAVGGVTTVRTAVEADARSLAAAVQGFFESIWRYCVRVQRKVDYVYAVGVGLWRGGWGWV